jgi:2-octaprenyl-6-methoxyphenol hydroxylase
MAAKPQCVIEGAMTQTEKRCDIAIVGAGPAGLAAAIALRQAGWDIICAGPLPSPDKPDRRTTALLSGSVQLLERLGVWEALRDHAAPLRRLHLIDRTRRLFRAPDIAFDAGEISAEAFGYNIPNQTLIVGLLDKLGDAHLPTPGVTAVETGSEAVRLVLPDGPAIHARLAVGADGRNSLCRQAAAIEARSWKYPQTAVVANFRHSRPHRNACVELHFSAGPFTVVPLPGDWSSLVWVERPEEAARLMALADVDFAAAIVSRLEGMLGDIGEVSARGAFPLSGMIPQAMARSRIALVGEAAHIIPPIGAQGLNLGFRDVADLVECLQGASDPGARSVLAAYDRARRGDVLARTFAADLLNRTLISNLLPFQLARGLGVAGLAMISPLRRFAMWRGMSAP